MSGSGQLIRGTGAFITSNGRFLAGGTNCCCAPCTNHCYVKWTSSWDCQTGPDSSADGFGWSVPASNTATCLSPSNVAGLTAWHQGSNCLQQEIYKSTGICCDGTNAGRCGTATTAFPGYPCPTNSLSGYPCAPECFTDPRGDGCDECCEYDITISGGCIAGTYRMIRTACTWFANLHDTNPLLDAASYATMGCGCGCDALKWYVEIQSVDNRGTATCFEEQCNFTYCNSLECSCFCPPNTGSWIPCDHFCLGPPDFGFPGVAIHAVGGAGCDQFPEI